MSTKNDAIEQLGELFIFGFDGTTLSDDTSAFLSQAKVGGIIYFAHNYESPEQIAELSNQIQENRGTQLPAWISVDQEGGRVQRFKSGFTEIPSALQVAQKNSPKLTFDLSQMIAVELAAVGVNLNYTPVADIFTNPKNKVIGDRAYGSDYNEVTKIATAVVRGHVTNGVQPCVKHFPGHGDTLLDSHDDLPEVNLTLDHLRDRELKPFIKVFKSRCNMVMTAHILNKNIDPDYPATLSVKTLQGLLRSDIRYSKIIVSDDLEMGALIKHYDPKDIPVLALNAGCDILLYRTETAARHAYQILKEAIDSGAVEANRVIESAQRILSIKKDVLIDYKPVEVSAVKASLRTPEHLEIVKNITE